MAKRTNKNGRVKRAPMPVVIADSTSQVVGLRTDRQIAEVYKQESQVRVVIGDTFTVQAGTAAGGGIYDYGNVNASDEFTSLVQQFAEFRITAIRFQIYDIATGSNVANMWSSFHEQYTVRPTFSFGDVADGIDARVISPGAGQTVLYWTPHGVLENQFQNSVTGGVSPQSFGGIRWSIGTSPSVVNPKFEVVAKVIVDFRGRY